MVGGILKNLELIFLSGYMGKPNGPEQDFQ
jgi:hypothetical protein